MSHAMRNERAGMLVLALKALRAQYLYVVNEPLPSRWVELIHRLNEQERAVCQADKPGASWGRNEKPAPPGPGES